mgnify:FL=1
MLTTFISLDLLFLIPEIFLIFSIIIILIYSIFISTKYTLLNNKKYNTPIITTIITNLIIFTSFILIILYSQNLTNFQILFNSQFIISYYTQIGKIFIFGITILCLLTFNSYLKNNQINNYEYLILILISILSICLLLNTNDLLHYYIIIELQSLCFYTITALKKNNIYSSEAGLKYFILGSIISGLLLLGIALLYGMTGLTNLKELSIFLLTTTSNKLIIFSFILIYTSLLFKLTIAPFHIWAPDVYEGTPSIITLFFNSVPKFSLLLIFIKILNVVFFNFINIWQILLTINILLSLIIATFNTFKQYKIKRFLIFSSMTHIGYIILGITTGTIEGIQSAFVYLIIYLLSILNIWSIYSYLNNKIKYLSDLSYLYSYNKTLGLSFIITMFSMAGVPPMAGFLAKFYSFFVCIENNFILLACIGILLSIICLFYYIRFLKIIYFEKTNNFLILTHNLSKTTAFVISLTSILLIYLFINPSPIFILAHKLALSLCL